jgi:hypothetical protein
MSQAGFHDSFQQPNSIRMTQNWGISLEMPKNWVEFSLDDCDVLKHR